MNFSLPICDSKVYFLSHFHKKENIILHHTSQTFLSILVQNKEIEKFEKKVVC